MPIEESSTSNTIDVTIVGAGLAGSEAALVLSRYNNFNIKLIEMRPKKRTDVHKSDLCAELVCSNSFKSLKPNSASGMLKYELASLASPLFESILDNQIDAGKALAVDRELFARDITDIILSQNNISLIREEFYDVDKELTNTDCLVLATGPLTSDKLSLTLSAIIGEEELAFYDAAAPIVMADSLNSDKVFSQNRYDEDSKGDYLNIPLSKDEYEKFIKELLTAERVIKKDFESKDLFQACQPIEEIARTGIDSARFGTMKPVGLINPKTGLRPYAAVQLRAENKERSSYNLVGFQTNLTFKEQKRVFTTLPGLENAEFARFGVMHRNTFINSPKLLNSNLNLYGTNIYFAGQVSGTEGYLEAIRSGHHVALVVASKFLNINLPKLSKNTAFGALLNYSTDKETKNYQPMHVNFGIMPALDVHIKPKQDRYSEYARRGNADIDSYIKKLCSIKLMNEYEIEKSNNMKMKLDMLWEKII